MELKFPIKPMLLSRRSEIPSGNWWYEMKLDGSRLIYWFDGKSVRLQTRSGRDVTHLYPEIAVPLKTPAILDGELVALEDGVPSFRKLQPRLMKLAKSPQLVYATFDILYWQYSNMLATTYEKRRDVLEDIELPESFMVIPRTKEPVSLERVVDLGFEGVVSKRGKSAYVLGKRSEGWIKTTPTHTIVGVVGGYTPGKGSRRGAVGSLCIGLWWHPEPWPQRLRYVGSVGSGLTDGQARELLTMLEPLKSTSMFVCISPDRDLPPDIVPVKPMYAVAVSFKEWTYGLRMRHPVFKGIVDEIEQATVAEQARNAAG